MTDTVSSLKLATNTLFVCGLTATAVGPLPTWIVVITVFVTPSITDVKLSLLWVTYAIFVCGLTAALKDYFTLQ
jgi:hypothetical protein